MTLTIYNGIVLFIRYRFTIAIKGHLNYLGLALRPGYGKRQIDEWQSGGPTHGGDKITSSQ